MPEPQVSILLSQGKFIFLNNIAHFSTMLVYVDKWTLRCVLKKGRRNSNAVIMLMTGEFL